MAEGEKYNGNERFQAWTQHVYQRFAASLGHGGYEEVVTDDFRDFWIAVLADPDVSSQVDMDIAEPVQITSD